MSASIDIGDLVASSAQASLHIGERLFLGANDCGQYSLPPAPAVRPILTEVSREQRSPGKSAPLNFAVVYRADSPGRLVLEIRCAGICNNPLTRVTVDVN